jgi:hypothetical protein
MLAPAGLDDYTSAMLVATMCGTVTELSFEIAQSADQALARDGCRGRPWRRARVGPAPATAALTVRPQETPDDDGDGTVVRVDPAMERVVRSVDDADLCLCSGDVHSPMPRVDELSSCDISQSFPEATQEEAILILLWESLYAPG